MPQKLKKFKYNERSQHLTMTLVNDRGNDKVDILTYESDDAPKPELEKVLQELKRHWMDICEVPDDWEDDLTVRGLTVGDRKGRMGIVISVIRDLKESNTPLSISCPYTQEELMDAEGDNPPELSVYPASCGETIKKLQEMAIQYYKGDRAQLPLFTPEAGDSEDVKEPQKAGDLMGDALNM